MQYTDYDLFYWYLFKLGFTFREMLVKSLSTTSSTSDETLADMPDLKKDAPSADDSKTIPSLESLHVHLDKDYTAS